MLLALSHKIASLGSLNQTDHQLLCTATIVTTSATYYQTANFCCACYYKRKTTTIDRLPHQRTSSSGWSPLSSNDSSREFHKVYIDPGKESVILLCCIEQGLGMGWVRHVIELEKVHQILHIFNMSTH